MGNRSSRGGPGPLAPTPTHSQVSWLEGGHILEEEGGSRSEGLEGSYQPTGGLSTNAHFSLLMASSAFLPLKLGEDRRRVAPCTIDTIVPPTEPRQWYRGLGRTKRNSSALWRWRQGLGLSWSQSSRPAGGAGKLSHSLPSCSPTACINLTKAHPNLTFVGIFRRWPIRMELFTMLWWERVAPLGFPVVP